MRKKFGMLSDQEGDEKIINEFLKNMHEEKMDFTNSFRELSYLVDPQRKSSKLKSKWVDVWRKRLQLDASSLRAHVSQMELVNPVFVPRNHLVQAAINSAEKENKFSVMEELLLVLANPYSDQSNRKKYKLEPRPEEKVTETFCGT
jgi:uncharacterized protein YdiU (UPF0061 family)